MLTTSTKYKQAIAKSGRNFKVKLVVGTETFTKFSNLKIKGGTNSSSEITLGDTVSSFLETTLKEVPKNTILKGKKAVLSIGLKLDDGSYEWIKVGTFNLEKSVRSGNDLKITAYDNFSLCSKGFFSDLKGNQKIATIINEQCKKMGISFIGGADDVLYDIDKLQGLTIREVIGILSAYCGKNAVMNADGNLRFVWYTDTGLEVSSSRFTDPFEVDEEDTYINKLDCTIDENSSFSIGTGIGIYFSCPGMTQERLNILYNRIKGFTYRSSKLNWSMAQPDIEAGDLITVVDKSGNRYRVPLMEYEFSCDGGFFGTIESKGKTELQKENEFKGPLSTKVERTYTELISTKKLVADTIDVYEGKFETIDTNYLNVNKKITANEIETNSIKGEHAQFKTTVTDDLKAIHAQIGSIDAESIQSAFGKISILETDVGTIGTIINRVTTSDSIHSLLINAETAVIDTGYFKTMVSNSITVSDLLAGDISTTRFKVKSDSGNFIIADNTIQIKDTSRSRVQIGKDASGDYNIYVWDKLGKLMFDATGVTAEGIQKPIIRDDMISPSANISGDKINISSVINKINGNSTLIESSHIKYDGKTLDVAFGSLSTTVNNVSSTANSALTTANNASNKLDGVTETTKTLSTQISASNGKISSLITDTTQIKKDIDIVENGLVTASGNIRTLQTDYSSLKQTVDGLSSTVGSHTSSITTITTTANTAKSTADTAKSTADSKAKTFVTTPTTPYKIGDLWVQGATGVIMKCKAARASGAYVATDWEKADKYTDDTKANAVDARVTTEIKKVTDKQSSIDQTVEAISLRVSKTETNVTTVTTTANNASATANTAKSNADSAKSTATTASANASTALSTANTAKSTADGANTKATNAQSDATTAKTNASTAVTTANTAKSTADTAKKTADSAILKSSVEVINPTTKKFKDVCGLPSSTSGMKGYLVIVTPITPNRMMNMHIKGYNYTSNKETIDISIGGYVYIKNQFLNHGFINNGSFPIDTVHVCQVSSTDARAVVVVGTSTTQWDYPQVIIDEVIVGFNVPADSYKDGFSMSIMATLPTTYTALTKLGGTDLKTEITTTKSEVAEHKVQIGSITSKVSAAATNITSINGKVTSLETWKKSAEVKITDSAIVSTVTKSSNWTTLNNTATTANSNASSALTKANGLIDLTTVKDTRSLNSNPQWYFTNYPKKTVKEFKSCTTIGISGEGTYGTLVTEVSWSEPSGGYPNQLFYPNNSQNIYRRVGISTTAWGAWTKVAGSHNIVSSINQTAEAIKIQASKIQLEGIVTANSRFKILADGSMEAVNGKFTGNIVATSGEFTGRVNATSGNIASWLIEGWGLYGTNYESGICSNSTFDNIAFWCGNSNGSRGIGSSNVMIRKTGIINCQILRVGVDIRKNTGEYYLFSGNIQQIVHRSGGSSGTYLEYISGSSAFGIDSWRSDVKLKKNISDSGVDALSKIKAIVHSSYDRTDIDLHIDCGYVAQQIEKIDKRFITRVVQPNGADICQINPTTLIPYITKSIQEMNKEYNLLKEEVDLLKEEIILLKRYINC